MTACIASKLMLTPTLCLQYTTVALLERRATILDLAKTWSISYFANLGGILFFLFVNIIWAGVFSSQSQQDYCAEYAVGKAQSPTWYNIFLSAIGGMQSSLQYPMYNRC